MIAPSVYSFRLLSKAKIVKTYPEIKTEKIVDDNAESDNKKRSFLKLAGMVGAGALAASLLPRKAEALVFGSTPTSNTVGVKNVVNARVNPATEDGNLASIKTNTDNLTSIKAQTDLLTFDSGTNPANLKVNVAAGDVGIMNVANQTINPATEDTLQLIKNQTAKLTFSGNSLMTAGGSSASAVGLNDMTNTQVNPATEDSLIYLRRIVKLMESQGTVDAGNRQKVNIDSFGTNTALLSGTGTGAGTPRVTVASDSSIVLATGTNSIGFLATGTNSIGFLATGTNTIGSVTVGGYDHRQFIDLARSTYAMGIRSNLAFS